MNLGEIPFLFTFIVCMVIGVVGLGFAEWERRHPEGRSQDRPRKP